MKTNLVQIGNSRGIHIPKALLEQRHFKDEVELEVRDDHLVVRSPTKPRCGWAEAFRRMHEHGDDTLVDKATFPATQWEKTDWE